MRNGIHDRVIGTEYTDEHGKQLSERDLRELAAFADGSLDPKRSAEVARRIEASPALAQLADDQLRALDAIGASTLPAPPSMRGAIDARAQLRSRSPRGSRALPRLRVAPTAALAGALAALAVALALVLPGGGGASVAQAAALADRGIALPAPAQEAADRQMLVSAVDGLHYPYLEDFGWRARGARDDRLASHATVTVYYADRANRWLAYTIVGGSALPVPGGARQGVAQGTRFAIVRIGSRTVVTWRRQGHTCVLSAIDVPGSTMIRLAAWRGTNGALATWSSETA